MLVFIQGHCLDTVVGTNELIALLQHNLHQFVVAILIFGYEDLLHVALVGATADADGAHVILSGRGLLGVLATDGAFKRHAEPEDGALADL